jgi:hypothetical protein
MAQKRLIDRIQDSLAKEGLSARTNAARTWLRAKVKDVSMPISSRYGFVNSSNKSKPVQSFDRNFIGKMYFYFYDPKTKDSLPYYDRFPLVIPIEIYKDGFLGLNLHYIHPKQRLILLDNLSTILTNSNYDEKTRFRISYDYISRASKAYQAMPCIKRYLFNHVRSKFLEISADEWDIAVMLPFETFVNASNSKVWTDSRKKF